MVARPPTALIRHRIQHHRVIPAAPRPFTTSTRVKSNDTDSSSSRTQLPPIIYAHLPEPLPYVRGLHLQESIIHHRLRARRKLVLNSLSDPLDAPPSARGSGGDLRTIQTSADVLLLLQHTPVYTAGRREKAAEAEGQLKEGERLRSLGADWVQTLRGGQTTYHGPGQLVGYPIIDLGVAGLSARDYVCHIERFLKSLFTTHLPTHLSIPPIPIVKTDQTGSFVTPTSKIASVGVHIRHRLTSHGFAFNVTRDPEKWFANVVACGLASVRATSVEAETLKLEGEGAGKGRKVELDGRVVKATMEGFEKELGRRLISVEEAVGMGQEDEELAEEAKKVRQLVKEAMELPLDKLRTGEQ